MDQSVSTKRIILGLVSDRKRFNVSEGKFKFSLRFRWLSDEVGGFGFHIRPVLRTGDLHIKGQVTEEQDKFAKLEIRKGCIHVSTNKINEVLKKLNIRDQFFKIK